MNAISRRARNAVTVFATMALLLVVPAGGAGAIEPDFEGVGVAVDECGGQTSLFTMELSGSFTGCLYNTGFEYKFKPDGILVEEGTETIVGCWHGPDGDKCGAVSTTYRYVATFAPDGTQLTGGCDHPFVGVDDDFAGATGGFFFKDDLDLGVFNFRGVINLP